MKRPRLSVVVLSAFLLLALPTSTEVRAAPLTKDEIDSLLGSQSTFAREEVVDLLVAVVGMADEEIARTSEEAVKAALLDVSPELARERTLAQGWRAEAERSESRAERLKGLVVIEAVACAVLATVFGVREVSR